MKIRSKNPKTAQLFNSFLAAALLLITSLAHAQEQSWVSTWTAPPSTIPPMAADVENKANHYDDQTLRLVVHTSTGGNRVRVRIANTHGEEMLKVGGVSIALLNGEGETERESIQSLSFAGQDFISVPRGASVLSDPLSFAVPNTANLSVSLYFPGITPFITRHGNANQQSWVAAGNQTSALGLKGATAISSWDFLTAIEVETAVPVKVIAAVGDSITDGYLSTVGGNNRWPNYLARRLIKERPDQQFSVVNLGISGNRVLREASPRFGVNLLARLQRDVFSIPGLKYIVLLEGINDIGMGSRDPSVKVSAEELISGYRQVIAQAHAHGVKIFGATLLPYEGASYFSEEGEVVRRGVNQWIRKSKEYDGYFDFEFATQNPEHLLQIRRDFTTDNLHPNDAGYKAMADSMDLNVFK